MRIIQGLLMLAMLVCGILFAIHDLRFRKVRNKALIPYLTLAIASLAVQAFNAASPFKTLCGGLLAGVLSGGILLLIALLTKGIGGGDIKFIAILSLSLGINGLTSTLIFLPLILGVYLLIVAIIEKVKKERMSKGGAFVPFIMASSAPYMVMQIVTAF